ncbi:MAG: EamA family transporter [Deltaproteobacteria bacterium]|nr:EamA family transporter [Deltaproteobacteria bacterium]MDP2969814.1 EamA family transporter [Deltaproteobacteria bacterium]
MVVLLLTITALLWGATPILEKMGLAKVDPLIGVTVRSAVVTAGLLILTFLLGKGKALMEVDGKSFLIFGASGLMAGILGMWTYYMALKMEATSKVVPIAACYPLVTALLSVLILNEGLSVSRVIGTALIVSGIWLVK